MTSTLQSFIGLYVELRFNIIPVAFRTKKPLVPWKQFQESKATPEEIASWFDGSEPRNIGVVTGWISGGLIVIDFDFLNMYRKFFIPEKIESQTLTVRTSRGCHVYVRTLTTPPRSFKIPQLQIDVKAEGSFVLAPPSTHPSGHVYSFQNPSIREVLEVEGLEESMWRRARELGVVLPTLPTHIPIEGRKAAPTGYRGPDPVCIRQMLQGVAKGIRDDSAVRLARYLHVVRDLGVEEALQVLMDWNRRNRPPIGEASDDPCDLTRYFKEKIASGKRAAFGCSSLKLISGLCCGFDQCEFHQWLRRRRKHGQL